MEQTQTENDIFGNICSQCGKHYASQYGLRNHIEIVHEGVKYACDQCDFRLSPRLPWWILTYRSKYANIPK